MLKSSVVKTANIFILAQKSIIRKQSTIECTRYASVRRILRNSTFPHQTAKCESAICKQRIALSAENRCNQEKPSITSNGVVLGLFLSCFRAFLRIKPPVCRLLFFAILTRCPRFITTTVRFWDRNGHFSSYREKARERIVKLSATGREFKDPQILSRTEIKNLTRPGVNKRQVSF